MNRARVDAEERRLMAAQGRYQTTVAGLHRRLVALESEWVAAVRDWRKAERASDRELVDQLDDRPDADQPREACGEARYALARARRAARQLGTNIVEVAAVMRDDEFNA